MKKKLLKIAVLFLVFAMFGFASCGSPVQQREEAKNGTIDGSFGFNYGDIPVNGSDGTNLIYKAGDPSSLTFSVDGYTDLAWYVDGRPAATGDLFTINAADYSKGPHTVSFVGVKEGISYSGKIPFMVE